MTTNISISIILPLILMQLFILDTAKSEFPSSPNATKDELSWRGDRSRRSPYDTAPLMLRVEIEYETNEQTEFIFLKQTPTLVNQHLPIVAYRSDPNYDVMSEVGGFVMYHDTAHCAAVVYFVKAKAMYGVIGMNYHIHAMPFAFDKNGRYQLGVVGDPYVRRNRNVAPHIHPADVYPPPFDTDAWEDFLDLNKITPRGTKRPVTCEPGPSPKRQRTEQNYKDEANTAETNSGKAFCAAKARIIRRFFLESLVFVTRDLAQIFKSRYGGDHIAAIVRYHIIYFNAVDVILKQLGDVTLQVHINIAKIVIEDDSTSLGFTSDGELQFTNIVAKISQYLHNHRGHFTPDSFDHVFVHTSRTIMDYTVPVKALTRHNRDIYEARKQNIPYEAVPITAIKFANYYAHYVIGAHEIARTFNIKITSKDVGLQSMGQCSDIMQRGGPKCSNCLEWSHNNQKQFTKFFKFDRNRCFLMNEPRSLRPFGTSRFLTPNQQCRCFGYKSHDTYSNDHLRPFVSINGCNTPLKCKKFSGTNSNYEFTIRPFDGTGCIVNKVCWNGGCEHLSADSLHRK